MVASVWVLENVLPLIIDENPWLNWLFILPETQRIINGTKNVSSTFCTPGMNGHSFLKNQWREATYMLDRPDVIWIVASEGDAILDIAIDSPNKIYWYHLETCKWYLKVKRTWEVTIRPCLRREKGEDFAILAPWSDPRTETIIMSIL
jgi:hypothetical protein